MPFPNEIPPATVDIERRDATAWRLEAARRVLLDLLEDALRRERSDGGGGGTPIDAAARVDAPIDRRG